MGALLSAFFSGIGISDLIKIGIKILFFIALIAFVRIFVSRLLGYIPTLDLSGCMGHYIQAWGFIDGIRLMLSIVIYGFVIKSAVAIMSKLFD